MSGLYIINVSPKAVKLFGNESLTAAEIKRANANRAMIGICTIQEQERQEGTALQLRIDRDMQAKAGLTIKTVMQGYFNGVIPE